jgi:hypothetical protein
MEAMVRGKVVKKLKKQLTEWFDRSFMDNGQRKNPRKNALKQLKRKHRCNP